MTNLIVFLLMALWLIPSAIAFILLLFFKTHFVVEYARLLGIGRYVFADEFLIWEAINPEAGYPVFLRENHNNFWTRLLGCPWCLATWLTLFFNLPILFIVTNHTHSFLWTWAFQMYWTFSTGFSATMLYFIGIRTYDLAFSKPKNEENA